MTPQEIDEAFAQFFQKMVTINAATEPFRTSLQIAFQEGYLFASDYHIKVLERVEDKLKC